MPVTLGPPGAFPILLLKDAEKRVEGHAAIVLKGDGHVFLGQAMSNLAGARITETTGP